MNLDQQQNPAAGRPGTAVHIGEEWVGWNDRVADPNAPMGGGGPGRFSRMPLTNDPDSDLPSPWRPGPTGATPLDTPVADAPKPANAPPVTAPGPIAGARKKTQSAFVDYDIEAKVVADGTGPQADTNFVMPEATFPSYEAPAGKITKFNGKFEFKGTIEIQTKYSSDANADSLSCYGRGTTDSDVKNRDITLGFHESCHRADFQAYLLANPLPDPPEIKIGMSATDYENAIKRFKTARSSYIAAMKADSVTKTDEVGFKKSKSDATKSCFVHELP